MAQCHGCACQFGIFWSLQTYSVTCDDPLCWISGSCLWGSHKPCDYIHSGIEISKSVVQLLMKGSTFPIAYNFNADHLITICQNFVQKFVAILILKITDNHIFLNCSLNIWRMLVRQALVWNHFPHGTVPWMCLPIRHILKSADLFSDLWWSFVLDLRK